MNLLTWWSTYSLWMGWGYDVSRGVTIAANVSPYSDTIVAPISMALSAGPSAHVKRFGPFQLTPSLPFATLEYEHELAGHAVFVIESVSGKVQIEVKYAEEFRALQSNFSDGPFPYAVALANTYRVETFEVTKPGRMEAFLLQGGQKWQSIRLLTKGSVSFSAVGFVPSTSVVDVSQLPGNFECDDEVLNHVWKLGARASQVACFDQWSQPAIWEVDDSGTFVRGMRSGLSAKGAFFENYTLEFDAMIDRGGIGWAVAHPLASPAKGIQLNLVGNLPEETTFVNTNRSLTPPNSVLFGYGYSLVNQTTLTSYYLDTFKVPFSVKEKIWYRVKTVLSNSNYLSVSVAEKQIFNVSLSKFYVGPPIYPGYDAKIPTTGSFGFGGWQDQAGYIKNVAVYDSANGTQLYRNQMTNAAEVLTEYGVHKNYASVCLDGPKRDRLVWLGDFYHTSQIIPASTSRFDHVRGTLQFLLEWQIGNGLLPYDPPIGYNASVASTAFALGGGYPLTGYEVYSIILPDYQILGLLAFANYVSLSNDLNFAKQTWAQWQSQTNWIHEQINSTTGLLSLLGAFLGPANGGSAINCAFVQALRMMTEIATVLHDEKSAQKYTKRADKLVAAINDVLWNPKLGIYSLSPESKAQFSVNSLAFCVTSGTASPARAAQFLSKLPSLQLGPGYMDSTLVNASDPTINISPNTNGFLLAALLSHESVGANRAAKQLLKSLWPQMLSSPETSTGASWEYVQVDGAPGLGLFTSLAHPWGGAPTYLLTKWVAGIRPAEGPGGFGYGNWIVDPSVGVSFGLKRAGATVMTGFGGKVEVLWRLGREKVMDVTIRAPRNTRGVFQLDNFKRVMSGRKVYNFQVPLK